MTTIDPNNTPQVKGKKPNLASRIGSRIVSLVSFVFGPLVSLIVRVYRFFFRPKTSSSSDPKKLPEQQRKEFFESKMKQELEKLNKGQEALITEDMIEYGFVFSVFLKKSKLKQAKQVIVKHTDHVLHYGFKHNRNGSTAIKMRHIKAGAVTGTQDALISKEEIETHYQFTVSTDKNDIYDVQSISVFYENGSKIYILTHDAQTKSVTIKLERHAQ